MPDLVNNGSILRGARELAPRSENFSMHPPKPIGTGKTMGLSYPLLILAIVLITAAVAATCCAGFAPSALR